MPTSSKSKRKSERKSRSTRSSKNKKTAEIVETDIEAFENGCDVVSSILEENRKSDDKIDDEIVSIASDTLLCLEEVYCDTNSTQPAMSPITNWGSEMNTISLVIGEGEEAMLLRNKIQQLTSCHDVQICKQKESFELCNSKGFVLIWLIMTTPVGPDTLSLTTSIRYASKYNRGTIIIGVANAISTVDLRLHGIDEIVIQPVDGDAIRQKYSKWTSVTIVPADLICSENDDKDIHCPMESPTTPMSSTSTLSADTSERSCGLSISGDNGAMGQFNFSNLAALNVFKCMSTPIGQHTGKQRHLAATDHTTKEKVRRNNTQHVEENVSTRGRMQTLTDSEIKRNRSAVSSKWNKCRIYVGDQLDSWNELKGVLCIQAHAEVAKILLDRERIKDSCDQLRVLLPYIRGRKTDMASILEMCVDYLKLVNAALPQDFQNQIVDILAKDSCLPDSPVPNEKKSKSKKPDLDSNTVSSTVDTDINNNEMGTTGIGGQSDINDTDVSDPLMGSKSTKRFRIQADTFLSTPSTCMSNGLSINPFDSLKIQKSETTVMDQQQSSYSFNGGHHPLYNEYDIQNLTRSYSAHEAYSNTFYGSPLATKQNVLDRDSFGLFLDPQPFYQFYGSNAMCPYSLGPIPDYVNPNAVLPVSYNTCKTTHGGTTFDEQSTVVSSQQTSQQLPQTSDEGPSKQE